MGAEAEGDKVRSPVREAPLTISSAPCFSDRPQQKTINKVSADAEISVCCVKFPVARVPRKIRRKIWFQRKRISFQTRVVNCRKKKLNENNSECPVLKT